MNKAQEIYQNPARNLILDLSEVPYYQQCRDCRHSQNCLALQWRLAGCEENTRPDYTHSSSARKHVKLLSPQPAVDQTLETAGLKLFFKVFHGS